MIIEYDATLWKCLLQESPCQVLNLKDNSNMPKITIVVIRYGLTDKTNLFYTKYILLINKKCIN